MFRDALIYVLTLMVIVTIIYLFLLLLVG